MTALVLLLFYIYLHKCVYFWLSVYYWCSRPQRNISIIAVLSLLGKLSFWWTKHLTAH